MLHTTTTTTTIAAANLRAGDIADGLTDLREPGYTTTAVEVMGVKVTACAPTRRNDGARQLAEVTFKIPGCVGERTFRMPAHLEVQAQVAGLDSMREILAEMTG